MGNDNLNSTVQSPQLKGSDEKLVAGLEDILEKQLKLMHSSRDKAASDLADQTTEFIADGVIVLHFLGVVAVDLRSMQIRKMRYSLHKKDHLLYEIETEGISIKED